MTLETRKYHIIEQITDIQDEILLQRLETFIKEFVESGKRVIPLAKPMRQALVVEELAQEQEYKGIKKKAFDQLIEKIHIEEPIEDLIAMI